MVTVSRKAPTPNQSPRNAGARPQYIVHHHMATTGFEGVLKSWSSGAKQGSCHRAISNTGEIVEVVPNHLRAWSLSSASFDSISLVTEIANQSMGGSWPVSAKAHEAAAQQTAEWSVQYGIPLDRDHVIDHGEVYTRHGKSYPTACAGGLNLDWIVTRAKAIVAAGSATPPKPSKPAVVLRPVVVVRPSAPKAPVNRGGGWLYWEPTGDLAKRVQKALARRGRYDGRIDGIFGPKTRMGVQITLNHSKRFIGLVDGKIQGGGCLGIQLYARDFGEYDGPLDSRPGPNTWANFALGLERP